MPDAALFREMSGPVYLDRDVFAMEQTYMKSPFERVRHKSPRTALFVCIVVDQCLSFREIQSYPQQVASEDVHAYAHRSARTFLAVTAFFDSLFAVTALT